MNLFAGGRNTRSSITKQAGRGRGRGRGVVHGGGRGDSRGDVHQIHQLWPCSIRSL